MGCRPGLRGKLGSRNSKFGRRLQNKNRFEYCNGIEFEVESYLNYQGDKFTKRFDANSLIVVTKAIDYFELKSLERSQSEYLFVSFTTDWLYPSHQSAELNELAKSAGLTSTHLEVDLPFGHDAFLLDAELQGGALRQFFAE